MQNTHCFLKFFRSVICAAVTRPPLTILYVSRKVSLVSFNVICLLLKTKQNGIYWVGISHFGTGFGLGFGPGVFCIYSMQPFLVKSCTVYTFFHRFYILSSVLYRDQTTFTKEMQKHYFEFTLLYQPFFYSTMRLQRHVRSTHQFSRV